MTRIESIAHAAKIFALMCDRVAQGKTPPEVLEKNLELLEEAIMAYRRAQLTFKERGT